MANNVLSLNNTNIKQITNFDIKNPGTKASKITIETTPEIVNIPGPIPAQMEVIYAIIDLDETPKFGYSCEENARSLPIYINFSTDAGEGDIEQRKFYVGKTGMLEIQPETQKNVNGEDFEDKSGRSYSVTIRKVRIPYQFKPVEA